MVELNPNIILQGQNVNMADAYYGARDQAEKMAATQKIAEAESIKAKAEASKTDREANMAGLETVGRIAQGLLSLPQGALNGQVVRQEVMANSHILPTPLVNKLLQGIDADPNADDTKIRQGLTQALMAAQKPKDYYDKTVPDANSVLSTETARRGQDMTANTAMRGQDMTAGTSRYNADLDYNLGNKQLGFNQDKFGIEQSFQRDKEGFHRADVERQRALEEYKVKNPQAAITPNQRRQDADAVLSILDQAAPLLEDSTHSMVGAGIDAVAGAVGYGTKGAENAAQLRALEGALISKMPKMSGPQSDKDVLLYKQMAGQIGDSTLPISTRKAAMETIRTLNEQYASPEVVQSTGGSWQKPDDWDEFMKSRGR